MSKKDYTEMRNRFTFLENGFCRVTLLIIHASEVTSGSVSEAREILCNKLGAMLPKSDIGEIRTPEDRSLPNQNELGEYVRSFAMINPIKSAGCLIACDHGLIRDGSDNFAVSGTVRLSPKAEELIKSSEPYRFEIRATKTKSTCTNKPDLLDKIIAFDLVKY